MYEVIKRNVFSEYQKLEKKNTTLTQKKRGNASKMRSAEQQGTPFVSDGVMATLVELETDRR